MKDFTVHDLAAHNGQNGQPAYVAYQGKVYDVTASKRWKNGKHMLRHSAGEDLTSMLPAAPHGPEVFEKVTEIGALIAEPEAESVEYPWPLSWLYAKFPFVKRHSHPFSVHFPLAFFLGGFLFCLLYLVIGAEEFERTSFDLLWLATLTIPLVMLTGLQSWWLFYDLRRTFPIMFKLFGAIVLFFLGAALSVFHLLFPDVLTSGINPWSAMYIALYAICALLVATIGYFGAQMTFPE